MLPTGRVWWGSEPAHPVEEPYAPPRQARDERYGRPPGPGFAPDGPYAPPHQARVAPDDRYGRPPGPGFAPPPRPRPQPGPYGPPRPQFRPPPPPPPPPAPTRFEPTSVPFVRRPGPPPEARPEMRRIVQGRRMTGPIPDPRTWATEPPVARGPAASPFAPPAPVPVQERRDPADDWSSGANWERETDWSGGFGADDDRRDDWSGEYDAVDDAGPDQWDSAEHVAGPYDEPDDRWADDEADTFGDRLFVGARSGESDDWSWEDETAADAAPDDWPATATAAMGAVPGETAFGDPDPAIDLLAPLGWSGPLGEMWETDGERHPKRRRRVVWSSAAAVVIAAVALPVAMTKSPRAAQPLAVEVLPDESAVHLSGWLDEGPNGEAPAVRIEVDGRTVELAKATGESRQRWEWRGPRDERGFGFTVDVGPGDHKVCLIAPDDNRTLHCADVSVPSGAPTTDGSPAGSTPPTTLPTDPATTTTPATDPATTTPTTLAPPPPAPTTAVPPPPAPTTTPPPPAPATWQLQMLGMVNAERAKLGRNPLVLCGRLNAAAQNYSQAMPTSGALSHTGPDGSTMTSRARAAGYSGGTLAENIARGYTSVEAVMAGWMGSEGHRNNILNPGLTHLGVGRSGLSWVQDFGAGGAC